MFDFDSHQINSDKQIDFVWVKLNLITCSLLRILFKIKSKKLNQTVTYFSAKQKIKKFIKFNSKLNKNLFSKSIV